MLIQGVVVKNNAFMRGVLAAAALAAFGAASAASYTRPGTMAPDDSFAYNSGTILGAVSFSDTVIFNTSALSEFFTVTVENTFASPAEKIQVFLADVKFPDTSIVGLSYSTDIGSQSYADFFLNMPGTYVLTISGTTGAVATGYTATIGTVAAVPEPETYALMLAGVALIGFVGSRRKAS